MVLSKDPRDPSSTSASYDAMSDAWIKIQTVLDGTGAMRQAETVFLPQHANESKERYSERLAVNVLLNLTELTLDSWVGRPFSDPIKFENIPPEIEDLFKDVDLVGTDIQTFARDWFRDGVAKAFSHVYVDFPRLSVDEDGKRTIEDDRNENVRPYWVHILPEQLIFADAKVIDGRETLREIRIREQVSERDGFTEKTTDQIRRVFLAEVDDAPLGHVEIYQYIKTGKKKPKWVKVDWYTFDLDFIPLVTFYSDRDSFMVGKPPLLDLADLNIAHWQSSSDQRAVLTVARFPMLALSGGSDEKKKMTIGPYNWLWSPDPKSKFYYVEHTGKAIASGDKDLQNLQDQMSEYGAEFLKKRPGGETATARALDSAEATSPLQDMVLRFSSALSLVIKYTGIWMDRELPEGAKAIVSNDYGPEEIDQAELNTLRETRKMRDISRKAYLKELIRRGLIDDSYDIEADALLLEQETLDLFGGTPEDDLNDGEKEEVES